MSSTELLVIGSGDAFGSGGANNSCYFVRSKNFNILLDCGVTSLVGLKRQGLNSNNVDVVFISHFHGDHYGGIPFLLLDAYYIQKREKPLFLVFPSGGEEKIRGLMNLMYPGTDKIFETLNIQFQEYFAGKKTDVFSGLYFEAFPVIHSEGVSPHGLRISIEGVDIGFSGDTEWTDALIDIAHKTSIFICECNFYDSEVKNHLSYKKIKEHASKLQTKKILLTHLGEEMLQNSNRVDMPIAKDGLRISI